MPDLDDVILNLDLSEGYYQMVEALATKLREFGVTVEKDEWRCPICGHRFMGLNNFLKHVLTHYDSENRAQIAAFVNMGRNLIKQGLKTIEDLGKLLSEQFDLSKALEY